MNNLDSEDNTLDKGNGDLIPTQPKKAKESTETNVDSEYFNSYNDINIHKLMLQDKPRTQAYEAAILQNSHLFKGKTVLDVGAGSGILSLFCKKAGAAKVYAVEASPFFSVLKEIIELNDEEGIIEAIHGKAEEIELPGKVDIIVSEWMGFYLLHESMLDSVIKARERHLQDDGLMFPSHSTVYCAAVQMDNFMEDDVTYWECVYGFNMMPVATRVLENKLAGGAPEILDLKESQLLSKPCVFTEYDLRWVQLDEVKCLKDIKFVSITRDGKFHGVALWFTCDFKPNLYDEELAEKLTEIQLDTGPSGEPTHWKQTVIIVPRNDSDVEKDEIVGWEISMDQSQDNPRHYELSLSLMDPDLDEHPVPCDCQMARCALFAALMQKEEDDLEEIQYNEVMKDHVA